LAGEQLFDFLLLGRHRHLRLGGQAEAALGEDLGVRVADGLVDGLGHDGAAVDLLQMRYRHLAGTEAVKANLVLQIDEARIGLGVEIGRGNADLEFVLQSLGKGFGDLHRRLFRVRPALAEPEIVKMFGARPDGLRQWFGEPKSRSGTGSPDIVGQTRESAWCGRRDSNPHNFRHWNLNPARLPVPPRPREKHPYPAAMPRAAGL